MREFELLPNENEIINMAREFSKVRIRQNILNGHCAASGAEGFATMQSADSLTPHNAKVLDECCRTIGEIESATRKLYGLAPYNLRPQIRRIVDLQMNTYAEFCALIGAVQVSNAAVSPTPNKFCKLLDVLIRELDEVLHVLISIDSDLNRLINAELIAMEGYTRLMIYCAVNKYDN